MFCFFRGTGSHRAVGQTLQEGPHQPPRVRNTPWIGVDTMCVWSWLVMKSDHIVYRFETGPYLITS